MVKKNNSENGKALVENFRIEKKRVGQNRNCSEKSYLQLFKVKPRKQ